MQNVIGRNKHQPAISSLAQPDPLPRKGLATCHDETI